MWKNICWIVATILLSFSSPVCAENQKIEVFSCDVMIPAALVPRFAVGMGVMEVTYGPSFDTSLKGWISIHAHGANDDIPHLPKYYKIEKMSEESFDKFSLNKYMTTHINSKQKMPVDIITDGMTTMVIFGDFTNNLKEMFSRCVKE